jgi:ppGpp synthetase/RelA/SpoT-type nucleotidyltranferase
MHDPIPPHQISIAGNQDWLAQYELVRPQYERFTEKIRLLLSDVLAAKKIQYHLLDGRTKQSSSFVEKISRSSKKYSDPLREVTDLSALRIITYYQDDAHVIGQLIEQEFAVAESTTREGQNPSEFGYQSNHYVVRISSGRAQLPEWHELAGFVAEIQVRTVLQHAWAAISHKLQYKHENDVPAPLKRKLFRLSALFEVADDEFISLRVASGEYTQSVSKQLSVGDKSIAIDYDSLGQFLFDSPVVAELVAEAKDVGFGLGDLYDEKTQDRDTLSELVRLCGSAQISSVAELDQILNDSAVWAREYLQALFVANLATKASRWEVDPPFICVLILLSAKHSKFRLGKLIQNGWNKDIAQLALGLAKEFNRGAT